MVLSTYSNSDIELIASLVTITLFGLLVGCIVVTWSTM